MARSVDSYRFTDGITKQLVKSWIKQESPSEIPWSPLTKVLSECCVSLISTGGIALKSDRPFDQEGERQDPWWGDPSYRIIPETATTNDIRVYHLHIDPQPTEHDINCLLPLDRLKELAAQGKIARQAPSHYSFMGYQLNPEELLQKSVPEIIIGLKSERVDIAILIPA